MSEGTRDQQGKQKKKEGEDKVRMEVKKERKEEGYIDVEKEREEKAKLFTFITLNHIEIVCIYLSYILYFISYAHNILLITIKGTA